ncbi:MAG: hypothetical protein AAFR23_03395 [Pseudomonadota bacterium]
MTRRRTAGWSRLSMTAAALLVATITSAAFVVTGTKNAKSAPGTEVLRCSFTNGRVRSLEDGKFKITDAEDLTFDLGAIDLEAQRASLITERGQTSLRIVRAINANHFLEVVTEGFLNMTTIYAPVETGGRSPAVHSRHFGLLGQPVITQYTGFCDTLK